MRVVGKFSRTRGREDRAGRPSTHSEFWCQEVAEQLCCRGFNDTASSFIFQSLTSGSRKKLGQTRSPRVPFHHDSHLY
ncbi:hypothetical protein RRG08_021190 [Elysia crispata]|uniref:Uncharacterized protein n=1 Tax=Elysia crispata TaxID=231223 RepID=A0AAE0YQM9_9GAST|nr:hypothetical protein RRG08_021190 [Elysia crispata]